MAMKTNGKLIPKYVLLRRHHILSMRLLGVLLCVIGMLLVGKGGYMQAKAQLAQFLIAHAWQKTLQDNQPHKPWEWADTYPVAKLSLLPKSDYRPVAAEQRENGATEQDAAENSLYVLAGATGRSLAFGPGLVLGGADAGKVGNTIIAGHRDTHFAILNGVTVGRYLQLETSQGDIITYRVSQTHIVPATDTHFMTRTTDERLTLITCYPFEGLTGGAELRFVVEAIPIVDHLPQIASI